MHQKMETEKADFLGIFLMEQHNRFELHLTELWLYQAILLL